MQTSINVAFILSQLKQVGDLFLTDFKKDAVPQDAETFSTLFSAIEKKSITMLKESISAEYSNIPWIEDEFDMNGQKQSLPIPEYWLFDSMDGAVQYLQHLPGWAFNLVLVREGKPYFAAVYNPLGNEMFYAIEGKGAYLNNATISPSKKTDLTLMLATFNHPPFQNKFDGLNQVIGKSVEKLLNKFGAVRNYGPLGLMLCSLAAGRIDIYYQYGLDTYNWLAGILIAREAGALVLTADGSDWVWGAESLLVTAQPMPDDFFAVS
ncbi:inositol monophosphatase family protein [Mucilaginibacter sp. CAU 1740]|uniref:inositol monophosphatase family protein n=1 Tax=Mucilaginibacter sp. CAU 1740 TaxID=3140365 RepID=UPI00325B80EA